MTAYLDNAATTMVCLEAAQAAYNIMTEGYGNPSSTHKMGRDAKAVLDESAPKIKFANNARAFIFLELDIGFSSQFIYF